MKIILNKNKLIRLIKNEKNLGFVPTMGGIHLGHLSLIKESIKKCNKTIVSIYVNKPQFNKKNDFYRYPKIIKKDLSILKKLRINYLYLPSDEEIYPSGVNKKIKICKFSTQLCGKFRPGHFEAVVDVIERFIKIIKPRRIFLGEKDMQQYKVVKHFINNKYKKIQVVCCKTIREKNGIAYSSRNFFLTLKQKKVATKVYVELLNNKDLIIKNKSFIKTIKNRIYKFGIKKIEYIEIVDINKVTKPYIKKNNYKIFIAYYLGSTRLIDNI